MKATGPREERETIVCFDEAGDIASLWTASESVYRKMCKRGWIPVEDIERHARFEFPKEQLRLPRPKSAIKSAAGKLRGFPGRSKNDTPRDGDSGPNRTVGS